MSTNGILDFQNTNKVIFRGTDSNVVVDTSNASIGIGIQGTEKPGSNLHVIGDASISSNLKLTTDTSILVNSNVVADFNGPHARLPKEVPLKKYPEIVFDASKADTFANSNAYAQAGYEISSTSRFSQSYDVLSAFNGTHLSDHFASQSLAYSTSSPYNYTLFTNNVTDNDSTQYTGEEIKVKLPNKIKLSKIHIISYVGASGRKVANGHIFGSNTGANGSWTKLADFTNLNTGTSGHETVSISTTEYYEWYSLVVTNLNGSEGLLNIYELEYYGYEEDPPTGDTSVDTTFTSIMNTPQTTGANVYTDAKLSSDFTNQVTGPTPVGTAAVHDNTNKYWEMNGELTSNITVEANTFLEGDQPHAVSVWFNSSNLEANVSNTCVFSVSDQEKLDSVNLDLQSNTWHNLTYAYQGEGGSRVTYLDGRKVAEDQAEDTFGDYPPFPMTGYSQGGYVVSANSEYNTTSYPVWEAFDDSSTSSWASSTSLFDGSGIATSLSSFNPGGGNVNGPYVKIEMPHKLALSYFDIVPQTSTGTACPPKKINLYASNDDTNWVYLLTDEVVNVQPGVTKTVTASTQTKYKYFILQVTEMNPGTSVSAPAQYTWTQISNLSFYGHRENDLVRLPDPTNVLKYPHVVMTGPAQRGYAVTGSTYSHFPGSGDPDAPWRSFDGITGDNTKVWKTYEMYTTAGVYSPGSYSRTASSITDTNSTQHSGEYLVLETPHKFKLSSWEVRAEYAPRRIVDYAILGSDTNSSGANKTGWTLLTSGTFAAQQDVTATVSSPTTAFKYHAIVVKSVTNNADSRRSQVHQMKLYGTGVDSIPIQIGGGNIDKVANFRVYDTFVGEDQALEIWDAQKDEFGRAKSSMTLHKGRLGLGTTEPQGRLAVADEPHNLEEFPPRGMTGYKNYFEGHGEYCVSVSNVLSESFTGYKAFNKNSTGTTGNWWTQSDQGGQPEYSTSTGRFSSTDSLYATNVEGVITYGQWLQIEFPYKINYRYSDIQAPQHSIGRQPRVGYIVGSNDLSGVWTSLHRFTNVFRTHKYESVIYTPPTVSTQTFKYFRLVIEELNNYQYAGIARWDIFGTREQGQSVLHDGQLTLTKSLNVPRIGPALDADDTPRRDRLVVEYNTSTNPTFEGAVRDTSGRGNDGILMDGAYYDATAKALDIDTFDSSLPSGSQTAHIRSGIIPGFTGNQHHTISLWFKTGSDFSGTWAAVAPNGGEGTANQVSSISYEGGVTRFKLESWSNDIATGSYPISSGTWYHVVVTYEGSTVTTSTKKFYVNGTAVTTSDVSSGNAVNFTDPVVILGERTLGGNEVNGSISNFKLYDIALTPEEVKTLYDMGRCDEVHHVVNFSKTRVGIGLGDGEAPRVALDVRDLGILSKGYIGEPYNGGTASRTSDLVIKQSGDVNDNSKTSGIRMFRAANDTNSWHFGVNSSTNFQFSYNNSMMGYLARTNQNALDFTGQHRTFIKDVPFSQAGDLEGLIVSSDQNKYIKISGGIETGSNAIMINESLPVVSLSNVVTDKTCFGVISASEDPEQRSDVYGSFVTPFEKERGDTRVFINSVGEGAIWVSNTNGSLESGDYITTSNVAGYGQKQDDDILHNYTVAKITMDCDFNPATQPIQIIKKDENGENVLDEHGQIQWEDHATETEKAYKVRYLTTDGTQTDEANAVHIAGFVGCTYHCG